MGAFPGARHNPVHTDEVTGVVWSTSGKDGDIWASVQIVPPNPTRCVVFAHGNACTANEMLPLLQELAVAGTTAVICPEYPGYGLMAGSTRPCMDRATSHVRYAIERAAELKVPVTVVGQSIGAALAAEACATHKHQLLVAKICLISPFSSMASITTHHATCLAGSCVAQDRFNTVESARWLTTNGPKPVTIDIVHGTVDAVIPIKHSRKIQRVAPTRIKLTEVTGDHNIFVGGLTPRILESLGS